MCCQSETITFCPCLCDERGHIRWDAVAVTSSVPGVRDSSLVSFDLMDHTNMKIFRLYIMLTLLVLASCEDSTTEEALLELGKRTYDALSEKLRLNKASKTSLATDTKDKKDLPILPPIILLDFGENNSTSEEKSKRTVENSMGYGYLRNNLLSGKYNYYFPGGKTGTTVSIEESISPFEPKTIIDEYKPITERPLSKHSTTYQPNLKPTAEPLTLPQQKPQFSSNYPITHQVFGSRTKLQKYSPPDPHSMRGSFASQKEAYTTIRPSYKTPQGTYSTQKPNYQNYISSPPTYENYQTTAAPPYDSRYTAYNIQKPYDTSTENPAHIGPSAFDLPKYTIENGVRYENKIVWKYPDGRIANTPPTSYVNSYSEYSNQRPSQNYHASSYQNPNPPQETRYSQEPQGSVYENPEGHRSNIYNQRPAQFPVDQESYQPGSYSNGAGSQVQNYDFSYQQKYGLKQREEVAPKYALDTANANPTGPGIDLSKYSPQAQKYLTKVLGNNHQHNNDNHQYNDNQNVQQYNHNYESLLNYNPSISQYIRNPASILNAQPTFIQAGGSLIPVIILRVDGAPPIQTGPNPSINLKALLQQYLSEYAESSAALSQTSNYDYKDHLNRRPVGQDTLQDLTKLTQVLSRFSQNSEAVKNSPSRKLANLPLQYETTKYSGKTSYDTIERFPSADASRVNYGGRTGAKTKVKNVQIIEN